MGLSSLQEQHDIIVKAIKEITRGDWKILVVDAASKKIIDNVVRQDDILNENIANVEMIEERRSLNPDMDAIYLLTPQPHVVDCLMADFERRRYRKSFLVWTAVLDPQMRRRIDQSQSAKQQLAGYETLTIDYYPRESHLITFRDPWSFPTLFHPACDGMVRSHLEELAQKITAVCVSLGEYPKVRYYKPRQASHAASVLCSALADFTQGELDEYAKWNPQFPPPTTRPQGILVITDRTMDLKAPLIHEFTYQAMAHDLLPIKEGDTVTYKTIINEGTGQEEEKELEIGEKDDIWVKNRHTHMKDTIETLQGDFRKFMGENAHFAGNDGDGAPSLNTIKDMMAGLPQFSTQKEAYGLHLSMATECMNIFQHRKLPDIATVEQSLATGLDEDFRKPKNIADQVVRLLDDENINPADRLRLIILYIMYRDGIIPQDIDRLLAHAALPTQDENVISNLSLLGAHISRKLKDPKSIPHSLFPPKTAASSITEEEYNLSRYEPALKLLLEDLSKGALDPLSFPYTKPPLDNSEAEMYATSQASLRSAKPTWAHNRRSMHEAKQRVIVFIAGGATFSESRACYEVSRTSGKDIVLVTSHMLNPAMFIRQVSDLSQDKRRLDLPSDRAPPRAPAHLFEREERKVPAGFPAQPGTGNLRSPPPPSVPGKSPRAGQYNPPTAGLGAMTLNSAGQGGRSTNGNYQAAAPTPPPSVPQMTPAPVRGGKLEKKNKEEGDKKKRGFFGGKK